MTGNGSADLQDRQLRQHLQDSHVCQFVLIMSCTSKQVIPDLSCGPMRMLSLVRRKVMANIPSSKSESPDIRRQNSNTE